MAAQWLTPPFQCTGCRLNFFLLKKCVIVVLLMILHPKVIIRKMLHVLHSWQNQVTCTNANKETYSFTVFGFFFSFTVSLASIFVSCSALSDSWQSRGL